MYARNKCSRSGFQQRDENYNRLDEVNIFLSPKLKKKDDFVGLSDSEQGLQALIDVVYAYSKKWRFEANVAKCAVVVFRNEKKLDGTWTMGDFVLPHLNYYTYLGIKFTCNGHWDAHLKAFSSDIW